MPDELDTATIPSMLIPRFSIRWLFGLTTLSAVFFLIVSLALKQHYWAIALSSVLTLALVTLLLQTVVFAVAMGLSRIAPRREDRVAPHSPFAQHQPPPQIVEPTNSE